MSSFAIYFQLGLEHILDINGYDHILFIIALCAVFYWKDWDKVLILVTAFTIGHSFTLALATFKILTFSPAIIEFLIPITIFITALSNLLSKQTKFSLLNYLYAAIFGLIHGLGFSNYLQSLLGKNANIILQLFAFNFGLEIGQLVIVAVFFLLSWLVTEKANLKQKQWSSLVSITVIIVSVYLIYNAKFW